MHQNLTYSHYAASHPIKHYNIAYKIHSCPHRLRKYNEIATLKAVMKRTVRAHQQYSKIIHTLHYK